jgi:uncharacterized protein (AIM24 family)
MPVNSAATQSQGGTSHCKYCGAVIDSSLLYCPGCGATVERSKKPTNSGWTELPPIKDMARLRVGASTCQIEGIYVPVADFNLAAGDSVYFSHHVLLWKDPQVELKRMVLANPIIRSLSGMPVVMTEAQGPGHIAFSRDEPGEMIALPLQPGHSIDVREHLLLAATANVHYGWTSSSAWYMTDREYHYPAGQFMDRFTAVDQPGLVLLHASGNVMVRRLEAGQTMLIKPAALVYMDRSVRTGLKIQYISATLGWHRLIWLHVAGPGRVAIQSAYEPAEHGAETITSYSYLPVTYSGNLVPPLDPSHQPLRPPPTSPTPLHMDPRHELVVAKAQELMVAGQIPPDAMQPLLNFAAQHGLSPYDVRLILKHLQSKGA